MVKIGIIAAIILALIAFVKWGVDTIHDGGVNECTAHYETTLRIELNTQVTENNRLTDKNSQLVVDLLNKQPEIKIVYEEIEKKVEVYVKENVACNLTRGGASLRNLAGDPEQLRAGYHPALSESDTTRPSTITQRRAEEQTHEWGKLYYETKAKYITLLNVCENNKNKAVE